MTLKGQVKVGHGQFKALYFTKELILDDMLLFNTGRNSKMGTESKCVIRCDLGDIERSKEGVEGCFTFTMVLPSAVIRFCSSNEQNGKVPRSMDLLFRVKI